MFCQEAWTKVPSILLTLVNVAQCQILWQSIPCMSQNGTHREKKSCNVTFCTSGCPCMQTAMISPFHKLRCTFANTNAVLPFRHYNIVVVTFRRAWLGNQCCSTLHSGLVRSEEEYPWWMMQMKEEVSNCCSSQHSCSVQGSVWWCS